MSAPATVDELLHHPLFESLIGPVLLCALAVEAVARSPWGRRPETAGWAGWAALPALGAALTQLPGWHWPVASMGDKLPWIGVVVSLIAGARLLWWRRTLQPSAFGLLWLPVWWAASLWLGGLDAESGRLPWAALIGGTVILAVAGGSTTLQTDEAAAAVDATVVTAVASLGLALLLALGGSLRLAQIAGMLASVSGVLAVRAWRGGIAVPASVPAALTVLWLGLAQAGEQLTPLSMAQVGLCGLAYVVSVAQPGRARPAGTPRGALRVVTAGLSFAPVLAALGWVLVLGPGDAVTAADGGDDDAYYDRAASPAAPSSTPPPLPAPPPPAASR